VRGKEYQLTYLDDHKQRIEDALRRHDPDRLNMLYGQLASKVKYQLLRLVAGRRNGRSAAKRAGARTGRHMRTRRSPERVTRSARGTKGQAASPKRKSQPAKKRRAPVKKPTLRKKRAVSRAARR
jgi:hypothetical protein